jgi:hypothetical protein
MHSAKGVHVNKMNLLKPIAPQKNLLSLHFIEEESTVSRVLGGITCP